MSMNHSPDNSPWGEIQDLETLYPGIYMVTTPGHGGILVEQSAAFLLSPAARKCGFWDGSYLCFEEDCDEQVVLRELLDKQLWKLPSRIENTETFEAAINKVLQEFHPQYWASRERHMQRLHAPRQKKLDPAR